MFNGQKTHITNKNEQKQNDNTSTMAAARNNDRSGNADIISGMRAAGGHHGAGVYRFDVIIGVALEKAQAVRP